MCDCRPAGEIYDRKVTALSSGTPRDLKRTMELKGMDEHRESGVMISRTLFPLIIVSNNTGLSATHLKARAIWTAPALHGLVKDAHDGGSFLQCNKRHRMICTALVKR